jgi:hypothetical protein
MKCDYLLLAFLLWGTIFFPMASVENESVLSEIVSVEFLNEDKKQQRLDQS